ncbi:MAG: hypothetical protein ACREUR_00130 [Nitrosospira sp.]
MGSGIFILEGMQDDEAISEYARMRDRRKIGALGKSLLKGGILKAPEIRRSGSW